MIRSRVGIRSRTTVSVAVGIGARHGITSRTFYLVGEMRAAGEAGAGPSYGSRRGLARCRADRNRAPDARATAGRARRRDGRGPERAGDVRVHGRPTSLARAAPGAIHAAGDRP